MNVTPIPAGYTSLTPFLVIDGAADAIDFYVSVFGAELVEKMAVPDADRPLIAHAELDFGTGRLQLGDPNPQYGLQAADRSESVCYSMVLYCPDVDEVVERAKHAGATIREELQTFVTGDRFASLVDPFGVRWAVMTRVENVDAAERDRRLAQWAQENLA
ncbi:VOC family protein [[Mycobacterium] wendilense]|uniref:VOC family protein n=1 Tax=[Mycobacterium] wendilense TaxID=3064284 RepID=A0ABM9MB24_9MYCO|nr:VOC family protein [Mycolicibacterium sp. MU0050]CAJ1580805.1 VOC family protein [Mycolicibacterium sp. MU0050]